MLDTDGLDITSTSDSRRTEDDASLQTLTLSLDSPRHDPESVPDKMTTHDGYNSTDPSNSQKIFTINKTYIEKQIYKDKN